jgi:hypothetical protein
MLAPVAMRTPSKTWPVLRLLAAVAVVAVVALVIALVTHPPGKCFCGGSKEGVARATVKKYAFEAFTQWAAQHPGQACPAAVAELNEYMNNKDDLDPWGNRYQLICWPRSSLLPAVAVRSAGPDGRWGGGDDISADDWRAGK